MDKYKKHPEFTQLTNKRYARGNWLKFRKSEDGAAAVEFALVAIPFFILLFSIIEQGMHFVANRLIDAGVHQISREIRTGQIRSGNTTEAQFRTMLCAKPLMKLFECSGLSIDVQTVAQFQNPSAPPVLPNGQLNTSGFGFAPGGRQTINVVRVYYDWPTVLDWGKIASMNFTGTGSSWGGVGNGMGTNGYRRIVGTAAFLNEPVGS